jgi:serine-type D-Ala-D-Ala carboxypeptidase/endopeptidase (penicillin-binding protein 4)
MTERTPLHPRRRRLVAVLGSLVAMVLALGAAFGMGYALPLDPSALAAELETPPVVPVDAGRAAPDLEPVGVRLPTCSVAELASDPGLGQFAGVVVDPMSNDILFDRDSELAVAPASVMKLVTGAAALTVLGPDRRFATTVVTTEDPETIVLVGGGDSTLSQLPTGEESVYQGAAKLQALAEQTVLALQQTAGEEGKVVIREVVVDSSLWPAEDEWDPSWSPNASANGYISRVTALQLDGDRANPRIDLGRRTDRPVLRAGEAFVTALRAAGNAGRYVRVTVGQAPAGASVLARVESPSVAELVTYMVKESDNTIAEMLARHVSTESGAGGTAAGVSEVLPAALAGLGLPGDGIVVRDGSGLSNLNRITPQYVALLLAEVYRSQGALDSLRTSLPIAGVDGSLDDRFSGANASVHNLVHAKTGTISGVRSLAGYIFASDDADLAFAFFATGDVDDSSRVSIENLVTAVYECGTNLADF